MLGIHGELLIMRVGIKNSQNVVHTRSGDKKRVHDLAKRNKYPKRPDASKDNQTNNYLSINFLNEPSTSYTPYLRKRPGDFEDAAGHAPRSYDKPDKARAVAGPRREEFDRQKKANREAITTNKMLMEEIERLKCLGQDAIDELTRRQNEATQKEAQRQAQEQANADQARIAQEKAQAEA
ncbi:hypothetical protein GGU10DRAFT_337899, partial [Lentinula aff. detonsa]